MSDERRCATCRFMAAPRWDNEWHSCVRILHGNGSEHGSLDYNPQKELAIVVDGSGYAARLKVQPTFGCVLHEEGERGIYEDL